MAERADGEQPGKVSGDTGKPIGLGHPSLRAWLDVTRLSNLPTVFSNVLTGLMLGFMAGALTCGLPEASPPDHVLLWRLFIGGGRLVLIASACFYMAGMTLNDVLDRAYDREQRPERPIPSGRLNARAAAIAVVAFNIVGLLVMMLGFGMRATLFALALVAAIIGYNALHRRFAAAVLLMGAVRGLLYFVAAAAMALVVNAAFWRVTLPFAVILTLYVAAVTYLARRENDAVVGHRALLAWTLPVLVAMGVLSVAPNTLTMVVMTAIIGLAMLLWLGRCARLVAAQPPATKPAVMGWLAGLCLIDAYFLALMGRPAFAGAAILCFAATLLWQRRVMAT